MNVGWSTQAPSKLPMARGEKTPRLYQVLHDGGGCFVHFDVRTYPCTGDLCFRCARGDSREWKCYFPAVNIFSREGSYYMRRVVLELVRCLRRVPYDLNALGTARCLVLELRQDNTYSLTPEDTFRNERLPKTFNVQEALAAIWGMKVEFCSPAIAEPSALEDVIVPIKVKRDKHGIQTVEDTSYENL